MDCLRHDPGHDKARRALNKTTLYREVQPNTFELIEPAAAKKALIIVFGDLGNIVNTFPVVESLRERFPAGTVWLTSSEHARLAQASAADAVRETQPRGIIPWEWIHSRERIWRNGCKAGCILSTSWRRSAVSGLDLTSRGSSRAAMPFSKPKSSCSSTG
jgi:hypothetical protein